MKRVVPAAMLIIMTVFAVCASSAQSIHQNTQQISGFTSGGDQTVVFCAVALHQGFGFCFIQRESHDTWKF